MDIRAQMKEGNRRYVLQSDPARRLETAENGQHPYAIVVCCSDSRVIPEQICDAKLGDLFVIRVAGNVLDNHQMGSIEYAAAHLHCRQVVVLGHTGCGAVAAALEGSADGFIRYITEDILEAIGDERDPYEACRLNVEHAVAKLKHEFEEHPEMTGIRIEGAVYDIKSGAVDWL